MTSEAAIQQAVLLALGQRSDVRLWRSNVGMGWVRDKSERGYRPQRFGVPGQPDLTGCIIIGGERIGFTDEDGAVYAEHPSAPIAVWLSVEVKSAKGRQSPEQAAYQAVMQQCGGVYLLVRSVEDATTQLDASIAALQEMLR